MKRFSIYFLLVMLLFPAACVENDLQRESQYTAYRARYAGVSMGKESLPA